MGDSVGEVKSPFVVCKKTKSKKKRKIMHGHYHVDRNTAGLVPGPWIFCYFHAFRRGFWRKFDFRPFDGNRVDDTRHRQKYRIITSVVPRGVQRKTTGSRTAAVKHRCSFSCSALPFSKTFKTRHLPRVSHVSNFVFPTDTTT